MSGHVQHGGRVAAVLIALVVIGLVGSRLARVGGVERCWHDLDVDEIVGADADVDADATAPTAPPTAPTAPTARATPTPAGPGRLLGCTLLRNQARFLPEWIAFHRLQGFDRFFIYDDQSTDAEYSVLLRPWVDAGILTVFNLTHMINHVDQTIATSPYANAPKSWRGNIHYWMTVCRTDTRDHEHSMVNCQFAAMADCAARVRKLGIGWMSFFDVDEFFFRPLVPRDGADLAASDTAWVSPGSIPDYLDMRDKALFPVTGVLYGAKGFPFRNWTGLVTETHVLRPALDGNGTATGCSLDNPWTPTQGALKSFVRGNRVDPALGRVHVPVTVPVLPEEFERGRIPGDPLRLNHYQMRSIEEARDKVVINKSDFYAYMSTPKAIECSSAERDTDAAAFAERVGECMIRTAADVLEARCTSLADYAVVRAPLA